MLKFPEAATPTDVLPVIVAAPVIVVAPVIELTPVTSIPPAVFMDLPLSAAISNRYAVSGDCLPIPIAWVSASQCNSGVAATLVSLLTRKSTFAESPLIVTVLQLPLPVSRDAST